MELSLTHYICISFVIIIILITMSPSVIVAAGLLSIIINLFNLSFVMQRSTSGDHHSPINTIPTDVFPITGKMTNPATPAVSPAPVETAAPAGTAVPTETAVPAETEASARIAAPAETAAPAGTPAPAETAVSAGTSPYNNLIVNETKPPNSYDYTKYKGSISYDINKMDNSYDLKNSDNVKIIDTVYSANDKLVNFGLHHKGSLNERQKRGVMDINKISRRLHTEGLNAAENRDWWGEDDY